MMAAYANTAVRMELDGAPLEPRAAQAMTAILVRQRLSTPAMAEIAFAAPVATTFAMGARLRLAVGTGEALFDGEVTGVEHAYDAASGRTLRVRAFDRLHRLRKTQHARTTADVRPADFIAQAVREIGLSCEAAESGPQRRLIVQHDLSDFDAMVRLATDAGLYLHLNGDTVRVVTLAGTGDPVELRAGRELYRARCATTAETLRRSGRTLAWDVLRTEVQQAAAGAARRCERRATVDAGTYDGLGERLLTNQLAGSAEEARALAQADVDRSGARESSFEGTAEGDPRIRPGAIVRITGIDVAADGDFCVTEAVHSFGAEHGYLTEFTTRPPEIVGMADRPPVLTFGAVADVADPERLSRVRARLPLCGDIESDWMPVVLPGAGPDKGLAVLPQIGDDVLIVFPQGDFAYGVVLGSLYGTAKAPGQADEGERPFVLRTAGGQTVTLEDSGGGSMRLETSGGDVIEMGPTGFRLRAASDLVIEAPGRTLTIRANAIEFEQG